MSNLELYFDFFLFGSALMAMLSGLGAAFVLPGDGWSKNYFITIFLFLLVYTIICLAEGLYTMRPDTTAVTMAILYFLESLSLAPMLPVLTAFLLHCCGESPRKSPLLSASITLCLLFFVLLFTSFFTEWFYYIGPDNLELRGPLYPLGLVPPVAILVLDLVFLIRHRERLSKRYYHAFLIVILPMMITLSLNMFVTFWIVFGFSLILCTITMFGLILFDQIDRSMNQQKEIARQRASILVLQMRPHFIYNTMTSIYYLCDQAPQKAKQVTLDFTTYLRKNFTAIVSAEPIPFSEELEHTRAYLAVEQAQFEDRLFVDYDTPFTLFRVPPLTLQPIVENAVKHGMDPDGEPLHITIRSRETDSGIEIIVEDDGPGFGTADENEPHIALKNIQQRLEMMCGGKMIILPRSGGGTVVKIVIDQAP